MADATADPKPIELNQDWIITIKLVETVAAPSPARRYDRGMDRRELEQLIQTYLNSIDGVRVRQVMVVADGPRYY